MIVLDTATKANPSSQVAIIHTDKQKETPHNISVKNFNPDEQKIIKPKIIVINMDIAKLEIQKLKLNLNYLAEVWLMDTD